jgi:hypothetical protein
VCGRVFSYDVGGPRGRNVNVIEHLLQRYFDHFLQAIDGERVG